MQITHGGTGLKNGYAQGCISYSLNDAISINDVWKPGFYSRNTNCAGMEGAPDGASGAFTLLVQSFYGNNGSSNSAAHLLILQNDAKVYVRTGSYASKQWSNWKQL